MSDDRYAADEARSLKAYGELPAHVQINETAVDEERHDGDFEFGNDEDDSSDEGGEEKVIDIDDI